MRIIAFVTLWIIASICSSAYAQDSEALPEYRSLRANKVHMRVGPGKMYPIIWTYTVRGVPLEILDRHKEWYRVRDMDGETGWMYDRLLSPVRTAFVIDDHILAHYHPDNNSGVVAKLKKHVIVLPTTCRATWCQVNIPHGRKTVKAWARKQYLWGVHVSELFEED